jgi:flagellar protein FlaJ
MPELKDQLTAADIRIFPETYLSLMLFSIFVMIPLLLTGIVHLIVSRSIIVLPLLMIPTLIAILFLTIPRVKIMSRSSNVDQELPYAAAYISTMATGGVSPVDSLERLERIPWLPAIAREARTVRSNVKLFAMDPLTAIDRVATHHPSRSFREFFGGYTSTIRSGGDTVHYLEVKTRELFKARYTVLGLLAERISFLMEVYITVGLLLALGLYTILSAEVIYRGAGMFSIGAFILLAFLLMPVIAAVIIVIAHAIQFKSPVKFKDPYWALMFSSMLAFAVFYITYFGLKLSLPTILMLVLLTLSIPPAIAHSANMRPISGVEKSMANFLRNLAEIRRTGLMPESCIVQAANRDYGKLTRHLKVVASQISWGVPLRRVLESFARKVKNWFALINMHLMVEAIEAGGGTVPIIDSLADFSQMSCDIEWETKMRMRPYIVMPYIGAILLVASTLGSLTFLIGSAAGATPIDPVSMITLFSSAVIFHSWTMGIVGGKLSEGYLAGGFKHAAALTIVAYLSAYFLATSLGFSI